jgi:hypothetical protein
MGKSDVKIKSRGGNRFLGTITTHNNAKRPAAEIRKGLFVVTAERNF